MTPTLPAISIRDLTVSYQHAPVLWDIDVDIPQGVLLAIVGPNGAGKTTLIKSALGLIPKAAGRVEILGAPYTAQTHHVGYVPQRGSVDWDFPISARDVALMGRYRHLGWFKRPKSSDHDAAMAALDQVGMTEYADRPISQLSGGQQQRVFLARALAQDAQIYMMDEPFVGVDIATEQAIISVLKSIRAQGKTVMVVHHDLQTITDYFDWALLLNVRTIALGPVADVITPETLKQAYGGRGPWPQ